MALTVLIADDHGILRAGLRSLLNAEPDLEVVGEASNGEAALDMASRLQPDVLLADISMPGLSGIEVAQRLRSRASRTRVLILTMHEDAGLASEAIRAGAAGYILKRVAETELIGAIRVVAGGKTYIQAGMAAGALEPSALLPAPQEQGTLSDADVELLRLIGDGRSDRQMAGRLNTTPEGVLQLRLELMARLGLHSRIELILYAREHGLLGA